MYTLFRHLTKVDAMTWWDQIRREIDSGGQNSWREEGLLIHGCCHRVVSSNNGVQC